MSDLSRAQALALIRARRTARAHGRESVPQEALEAVLEAVRWAPSAANRQPWELIVVTDEPSKRALREAFLDEAAERGGRYQAVTERQADLLLAPVVIAVCGDERVKRSFVDADAMGEPVQEELFLLTMGAAIENLLLMATACGLASTWIARAARVPRVRELLAVPPWLRTVALVALSGGAESSAPPTEHARRPIGEKVHRDRFAGRESDAV